MLRGPLRGLHPPPPPLLLRRWGPRRKLTGQQRKFSTPEAAYRSGLEEKIASQLEAAGVRFGFETLRLPFQEPAKDRHYTPDFVLQNGIVIETKGLFLSEDRQKHKLVKAQHPDIDIRFVFSDAQKRISKQSKTTYAKWATDAGFLWAHKTVPPEWLEEEPNEASKEALLEIAKEGR